jgi:integration host factor subunit beta
MIKSELVKQLHAQNPHMYQRDLEKVVNAILDQIVSAIARGDRVELRGFGMFGSKVRSARVGRNPKNGMEVPVPKKLVPYFKAGKEIRDRLNRTPTDAHS